MPSFTTLGDVTTYLGNAHSDSMNPLIVLLIPRLSADFELETDRTFDDTPYFEWMDGTGDHWLRPKHYPLVDLRRVAVGTEGAATLTNTTTNGTHATATISSTELKLSRVVSGVADTDSLTLSTSATLALLATAITALGNDWTLTIASGFSLFPSVQLRPGYLGDCRDPVEAQLRVPGSTGFEADIDSSNANLLFSHFGWPRGHQNIFVDYTAGYEIIPVELTHLITKVVAWATLQSGADFTMKREILDNYEYERDLQNLSTSALEQFKSDVNKWKRYSYP